MAKGIKTGGRQPGSPNKTTLAAREAIARLVDGNAERMQGWLDQIAAEKGPEAAWRCMTDVIEYHIPKLQRSEINASVRHSLGEMLGGLPVVEPRGPDRKA